MAVSLEELNKVWGKLQEQKIPGSVECDIVDHQKPFSTTEIQLTNGAIAYRTRHTKGKYKGELTKVTN